MNLMVVKTTRVFCSALAGALLAAVSACGGSSGGESTSPPAGLATGEAASAPTASTAPTVALPPADAQPQGLVKGGIWEDSTTSGRVVSWGTAAVGGGKETSGFSAVKIYVLDSGVEEHFELNLLQSVSANNLVFNGKPVTVGCYPHATHVAGIIGGKTGVYPNAPLVSVSIGDLDTSDPKAPCSNSAPSSDGLIAGLERIYTLIRDGGGKRVAVVNISLNSGGELFDKSGKVAEAMRKLATPDRSMGYPGAFIAQSAGDGYTSACLYAYNDPRPDDGIMVVGALDSNGQPISMLNHLNGILNNGIAADEAGSNFGACTEVWAPGQRIYSTWAHGSHAYMSGTGMAASHIAGVAALLAEKYNLTTPAEIEARIRKTFASGGMPGAGYDLKSRDKENLPILAVNLEGTSYQAKPTVQVVVNGKPRSDGLNALKNAPLQWEFDSVGASACKFMVLQQGWDPLESTCRHASLSIL